MTIEPQPPGTHQPQPFADAPQDAPGGCSRPLLIGCALIAVLLGLGLLAFLWKAPDLMPALLRWSLGQFEQQISSSLPADLSEEERQRLADGFDGVVTAVEDGTADPAALQRLQGKLMDLMGADQLSREQVLELIEALEAVAGGRPPPDEEPAPADEPLLDPLAA